MPNNNYTAILFVLDSSGSMDGWRFKTMQNALHLMLEQQARKLAGYLTVDVGYFDSYAYQGEQDGDPMTINLSMFAAGGTQIYDNTAKLLDNFENRLNGLPENEKPGHVVVIIVTDGQSQYAQTQSGRNLPERVKGLTARGWDFAFLSADPGALAQVIGGLGIPRDCGVEEEFTEQGVQIMAEKLGQFVSMSRSNERGHF